MAALKYADRVKESTITTGTGALTLAGAVSGFQTFAAIGNGNRCVYCIDGGSEWEVGLGTYTSSGTTLSRDTVIASSNSNALVNFSSGTKHVFVTTAARNSGLTTESALDTAYEADFSAMSSTSYSNGNTFAINGYTWAVSITAGGSPAVQIVNGQGLKLTRGTVDDAPFVWADWNTSGNGGISLPAYALGVDHVRIGRPYALWAHIYAYNLATSGDWSYALSHGAVYPYSYTAVRRARNTQGVTNNTTTGGLVAWTAWGNTGDIAQALCGSTIGYGDSPADQPHTGTEDVVCMVFKNYHDVDIYYGTYSSGWPTFASMILGAELKGGSAFPPINSAVQRRTRDPKYARTGFGAGGGTDNAHAITIARMRVTYWNP